MSATTTTSNTPGDLDIDNLLEESFNTFRKEHVTDIDKKRSIEQVNNANSDNGNDIKKRRSKSPVDKDYSKDREYSSRDRDYSSRDSSGRDYDRDFSSRDRDGYNSRDRDYSSRDSGRDSYYSRDRDYDRGYDYRDYGRDRRGGGGYYSKDRYDRNSRDRDYSSRDRDRYDDRSRDRDYKSSSSATSTTPATTAVATTTTTTITTASPNRSSKERDSVGRSNNTTPPPQQDNATALKEPDEESDQRTVFISNLSPNISKQDLFSFFAQAGKVLDVSIIIDRVTNKPKGVGYVEFESVQQVQAAVALSGKPVMDQPIQVHTIQPEKKVTKSSTGNARIYVGYINLNATEEQIRNIFLPYGEIDFINIHTKPGSKYAFVQFRNSENAKKAILGVNGMELMGKNLKLNMVSEEKNANGTYIQLQPPNGASPLLGPDGKPFRYNNYNPNNPNHQNNPHYHPQQQQQLLQQQLLQQQLQQQHIQSVNNMNNSFGNSFKDNNPLSSLDEDDGGIPLTAQGRAILTAKLQGKIPSSTPIIGNINSVIHNSHHQQQHYNNHHGTQQQQPQQQQQQPVLNTFKSSCMLLKNMFDPEFETDDNWDKDILNDTKQECLSFGQVEHIYLDKATKGHIYVRFNNTEAPLAAISKLHGRWFSQRTITAELVPEPIYKLQFPW